MKKRIVALLQKVKRSLLFKSLFMLFITMCVACVITYMLIFFTVHRQVFTLSTQIIEDRAESILYLSRHTDLTLEDLVKEYRRSLGEVELIFDFKQLPPLRSVILESDMVDEKVYFCARRDIPYGVIRIDGKYILISPFLFSWEVDVIRKLVTHTLLLCAFVASICTVFALHRSFRPLRELDAAIQQVAQGDFSARVAANSPDELGKIGRNFNWMTEELGRIEYLRRDFVSNVSHEFKTPLAAVQGSARMLATLPPEKLTKQRLDKYTGLILEQTARMTTLTSNLLRLSRLEHQTVAENVVTFSLDEQIRCAILALENLWNAKKLQLEIQMEEIQYQGDMDLLYQVWSNLLSNAIKFSYPTGLLEIRMAFQMGIVTVEIQDHGEGMSQETLGRLFEKFYQGDTSRKTEGCGLGLSIVKRIIDLHQGEIYYESAPGKGTVCGVLLPMAQSPNMRNGNLYK